MVPERAFSFSTRFLTALFPFFLIGVGGLRYWVARVYPILAICVAWSMLLASVHVVGYDGIDAGQTGPTWFASTAALQRRFSTKSTSERQNAGATSGHFCMEKIRRMCTAIDGAPDFLGSYTTSRTMQFFD